MSVDATPVVSILSAVFLALWIAGARAEPVDCNAPNGADEVAICKNEKLKIMDGELDRAYRAARVRLTASLSNSIKVMHEDWIKTRRKPCADNEKCLMARIIEEIKELDASRPSKPTWILEVQ
jgi:uncharacterized protein